MFIINFFSFFPFLLFVVFYDFIPEGFVVQNANNDYGNVTSFYVVFPRK